jgi:hypothetical protein
MNPSGGFVDKESAFFYDKRKERIKAVIVCSEKCGASNNRSVKKSVFSF